MKVILYNDLWEKDGDLDRRDQNLIARIEAGEFDEEKQYYIAEIPDETTDYDIIEEGMSGDDYYGFELLIYVVDGKIHYLYPWTEYAKTTEVEK